MAADSVLNRVEKSRNWGLRVKHIIRGVDTHYMTINEVGDPVD